MPMVSTAIALVINPRDVKLVADTSVDVHQPRRRTIVDLSRSVMGE
jgi:hypothetical protein